MTAPRSLRFVILASLLVFGARDARAQDKLIFVIGDSYVDSQSAVLKGISNANLFSPSFSFGPFDIEGVLGSALVNEIAAFPIGSSSGGFTYFFDATSGAAVRSSPSFGPAFAERPLTSGRGKLNLGLTYLHRSFTKLEGRDLDDGSLKFYAPLTNTSNGVTADLLESALSLEVKSDTATFFATYGVSDKLDVSLAVPVQHVKIDAAWTSQLIRFGPNSTVPGSQIPAARASKSGSANGIGDVAIRAKYNLLSTSRAALAAGVDVRAATGDDDKLLGTGNTRTKLYVAASSKASRIFPHANFGYTFKSQLEDTNGVVSCTGDTYCFGAEVSYVGGAEIVVNPRVTVIGDIVGRSLAKEGRLKDTPHTFQLAPTVSLPASSQTVTELNYQQGLRLNTTLAALGAKFNPRSTFIISAHVLFPLTDAGIKSRPTPVIGADYSF